MTDHARVNSNVDFSTAFTSTNANDFRHNDDLIWQANALRFLQDYMLPSDVAGLAVHFAPMVWNDVLNCHLCYSSIDAYRAILSVGPGSNGNLQALATDPFSAVTYGAEMPIAVMANTSTGYQYSVQMEAFSGCTYSPVIASSPDMETWTERGIVDSLGAFNYCRVSPQRVSASAFVIPMTGDTTRQPGIILMKTGSAGALTSATYGQMTGSTEGQCCALATDGAIAIAANDSDDTYLLACDCSAGTFSTISVPTVPDALTTDHYLAYDSTRSWFIRMGVMTSGGADSLVWSRSSDGTTWTDDWYYVSPLTRTSSSGTLTIDDVTVTSDGLWVVIARESAGTLLKNLLVLSSQDGGATWNKTSIGTFLTGTLDAQLRFSSGGPTLVVTGVINSYLRVLSGGIRSTGNSFTALSL